MSSWANTRSDKNSERTVEIWMTVLVLAFICAITTPAIFHILHLLVTFPSWVCGLILYRSGPRTNSLGSILALIGIAILTIALGLNLTTVLWFGHDAILK